MKILLQIGVVFGVYWGSQCIEAVLPFPFPASVISLLVLLGLLLLGVVKVDHIREKSDFLLGNLGFFFVPAGVGIINYANVIWENAAAFVTICVVSTVLTYGATAWAVHLTCRLMEKKGGREKMSALLESPLFLVLPSPLWPTGSASRFSRKPSWPSAIICSLPWCCW